MLRLGQHTWSERFVLELARLLVEKEHYGTDRFAKALRPLAEAEAPDLFCVQDKIEFARRSGLLYASFGSAQKQARRLHQLRDGRFAYWVYRADRECIRHQRFEGVAMRPEHPFWRTHFPPNCWGCWCSVFGTGSERGILRVGGIPGKPLPEDWNEVDPRTGLSIDLDRGFHTDDFPYLPAFLTAISDCTISKLFSNSGHA